MVRILIVDDDVGICRKLSEILTDEGHSVETATSGKEALKTLKKEEFDIVLTDLIMPGVGGMEILTVVQRISQKTQVIMITAFGTIENAVEAIKMGAADYITKPFKTDEIQIAVKRALEEINFRSRLSVEKSADAKKIISSLNAPMRRAIVIFLEKGEFAFSKIMRAINADDPTKLNFHLKKLKAGGLIAQDEDKKYFLTVNGRKALGILSQLKS